jgi:hypothetical protein
MILAATVSRSGAHPGQGPQLRDSKLALGGAATPADVQRMPESGIRSGQVPQAFRTPSGQR